MDVWQHTYQQVRRQHSYSNVNEGVMASKQEARAAYKQIQQRSEHWQCQWQHIYLAKRYIFPPQRQRTLYIPTASLPPSVPPSFPPSRPMSMPMPNTSQFVENKVKPPPSIRQSINHTSSLKLLASACLLHAHCMPTRCMRACNATT